MTDRPQTTDEADRRAQLLARLAQLDELETRRCERDFHAFVRLSWRIFEPQRAFKDNWHIGAMCEHLQAVAAGQIQHLGINVPPSTGKTSTVSVQFPAWVWIPRLAEPESSPVRLGPAMRFMCASYDQPRAIDANMKMRDVVLSDWYQQRWPVVLREDLNMKTRFDTTAGGYRIALSVGAPRMGEHPHYKLIDDPHNPKKQLLSDREIEAGVQWYDLFKVRGAMVGARTVLVMQRLHEKDLAGHLRAADEAGQWTWLVLPMRWEPKRMVETPIGWRDPREGRPGALLWPDEWTEQKVNATYKPGTWGDACTPGETPIIMADWTTKRIDAVQPGDVVLGFAWGGYKRSAWAHYQPATVKNVTRYERAPLVELVMASGRRLRCTPQHRWLRAHKTARYLPAVVGASLRQVCNTDPLAEETVRDLHQIAGIIDGEGTINRCLGIYQSPESNPDVYAAIERLLRRLGLQYTVDERVPGITGGPQRRLSLDGRGPRRKHARRRTGAMFRVRDAFALYRLLLRVVGDFGKAGRMRALMDRHRRMVTKTDRVLAIHSVPVVEPVYALETTTGNYVAAGYASSNSQFQQRPAPAGGLMFKRGWFRIVHALPADVVSTVRAWDIAGTDEEARGPGTARSAGVKMHRTAGGLFVISDIRKGWWSESEVDANMRQAAALDGQGVAIREEQEPGSAGLAVIKARRRALAGYDYRGIKATGDKVTRARPLRAQAEGGNVALLVPLLESGEPDPRAAQAAEEFLAEVELFPAGELKDQTDAAAHALNVLTGAAEPLGLVNAATPDSELTEEEVAERERARQAAAAQAVSDAIARDGAYWPGGR